MTREKALHTPSHSVSSDREFRGADVLFLSAGAAGRILNVPLVTSTFEASQIDRKPVSPQAEAKEQELNAALDAAKAGIWASALSACRVVP